MSSRERFTAGTGEQADEGRQQPATSLSPPFDAPVEHARVGRRYPVLSERRTGYDRCTGGGVTHRVAPDSPVQTEKLRRLHVTLAAA